MSKTWTCGDCGTRHSKTVDFCTQKFYDYLAVNGGSVEAAIGQAVERAIAPLVNRAMLRINRPRLIAASHLAATSIVTVRWSRWPTNERKETK